jgi:hypothetical protein
MNFSDEHEGGTATVAHCETARQLTPTTSRHSVELKDIQLDLRLSPQALNRMSEVDQRTLRVFVTSRRFAFR